MTKTETIEDLAKKLGYKVVHTTEADYARSCEREDAFQKAERRLIVVSEQGRCDMKKN